MESISTARAIIPVASIYILMAAIAIWTSGVVGIDGSGLVLSYIVPALSVMLVAILVWMTFSLVAMARRGEADPVTTLRRNLFALAPILVLPVVIEPLFLAAFTTAKTAIAPLVSFTWDARFADLDAAILRTDAWRLTFTFVSVPGSRALEYVYTAIWGFTLAFSQAFVALYASRAFVARYFLAMNLCWLLGGILLAYAMPAAGPVFAHVFEPSLTSRFAGINLSLGQHLAPDGPILRTQEYLLAALGERYVVKGGGISAMPSMHIAIAIFYILAARGTPWFRVAIVFAALIAIGSVHFGYHYAVDGLVAAAVAVFSWKLSVLLLGMRQSGAVSQRAALTA